MESTYIYEYRMNEVTIIKNDIYNCITAYYFLLTQNYTF